MTTSTPVGDAGPAVEVAGLVHDFGRARALSGVTFTVGRGEIFALLGPNGAGKTTTMRILLTLLRATAGHARVDGIDVATGGGAVRRSVGWVPQRAGAVRRRVPGPGRLGVASRAALATMVPPSW